MTDFLSILTLTLSVSLKKLLLWEGVLTIGCGIA